MLQFSNLLKFQKEKIQLAKLLYRLGRLDDSKIGDRVLLLNIEQFHEHNNLNLCDACNCNKYLLDNDDYVPFCIYNIMFRNEKKSNRKLKSYKNLKV